ncbi:hypothetical protein X777_13741 [Ooceraea biroi]|uniref:Uncharacterized protein n=1 Tax=Ooceraea biroi TaxID=2015173 RepID=A0A026VXE1_OOCBI|nr:hypothetical protein X777_13741 [Ooceraea biroi]
MSGFPSSSSTTVSRASA